MLVHLHIFFAFLSLVLLVIRGAMQLNGKNWRSIKLLKILPHLSDTLLIVSGAVILYLFVFDIEWWLIAKFALLILYILFAAKFFSKKVVQPKPIFFLLACVSFIGAILIAYLK
ncbi:Invasion gene expression up-regulator [Haemophilus influenzae]|uniref:SirB2 family protein n=1 Tax=Haemophilus influenzae TaxID=727 RepID=UPI000D01E076|nr:SirB2 family protein [Haemophilus influenzae]PRM15114.1 Invasion gene expression up-regulator [Haemophilus influenzae]